jgi:hypothetical protein
MPSCSWWAARLRLGQFFLRIAHVLVEPRGAEGDIVNCDSDPGKLGSLSVSSYSPYSMRTIHYVPLGPPVFLARP